MPDETFKQSVQAVGLAAFGWFLFVITDTIVKWLTADYGVAQILCVSSALGMVLSAAWIFIQHGPAGFKTPYLKWHLLRAATIVGTAWFVINSLALIPLADFYGIIFLNPMLLSILCFFIYGEKIGWHRATAIITGFIGVLVLAGPQFDHYNTGITYALIAVLFVSSSALIIRKMRDEKTLPLYSLFPMTFNFLIFLPGTVMNYTPAPPGDLALILICAPLAMVAMVALASGLAKAPEVSIVAPFHYTQIIWGAVLGYLIFGDVPTWTTALGTALIVGGGIYLLHREHAQHKKKVAEGFADPLGP